MIDSATFRTPVKFTVAEWEAAGFKQEVCLLREIEIVPVHPKKKRKRSRKKKQLESNREDATLTRPSLCAGEL